MSTGNEASAAFRVNLSLNAHDRLEAITRAFENHTTYSGWDARFCRDRDNLRLVSTSTSPPSAVFELTVAPYLCNVGGNLHGGAATTILDNVSSAVLDVAAKKRISGLRVGEPDADHDVLAAGTDGGQVSGGGGVGGGGEDAGECYRGD